MGSKYKQRGMQFWILEEETNKVGRLVSVFRRIEERGANLQKERTLQGGNVLKRGRGSENLSCYKPAL